MKPIRVLMIVPQYPFPIVGGLEKQARLLSTELVRAGHKVHVLSGKIVPEHPSVALEDGVVVHRLPWPENRLFRWLLLWPLAIAKMVRLTLDSDVVHAHVFSGFGLLAIGISRLLRRPILVKLPNVRECGLPGLRQSRFGAAKLQLFKRADAVVAMSQESIGELGDIAYDPRRVLATPNGITLASRPTKFGPRLSNEPVRLVFLGRLFPGKGLEDLVKSAQQLNNDGLRSRFVLDIYGEGIQRPVLTRQIENAGLCGSVRLLGHHSRPIDVLPEYDALVLPSYAEGNSNVILEAMATGLPLVSTRVGGTPMLIGPEGAAWLYEPGDVQSLTNLLKQLISDVDRRVALGLALRQRAERFFDIVTVVHTYEQTYLALREGRREDVAALSNPVVLHAPESK